MSDSQNVSPELQRLVSQLCDGELSPDDCARLKEILLADASARSFYRECLMLHGELAWSEMARRGACEQELPIAPATGAPVTRSPILGWLGSGLDHLTGFFTRSFVLTLLLAIGLPGIVLFMLLVDIAQQPVAVAPVPAVVAEVSRMHECVWAKGSLAPLAGGELTEGDRLRLDSGLVELVFRSGATVLLEGPAEFDLNTPGQGMLHAGSLVARVPEKASGFTIDTPGASVVDLGTDFGVSVAGDGTVEAHVFEGEVEVAVNSSSGRTTGQKRTLHAEQAVRVHAAVGAGAPRIDLIDAVPTRFARRLPSPSKPKAVFAHRGGADPTTEGWKVRMIQGNKLLRTKPDRSIAAPVDDGTPAWMMANSVAKREFQYAIIRDDFGRELVKQGQDRGWVLRARVKAVDNGTNIRSSCHVTYCDGDGHRWSLSPTVNQDGSQYVVLQGDGSHATRTRYQVPNSRNRYVEYEVRCKPGSNEAEVFVDGQRIATKFGRADKNPLHGVRFGTARHATKVHFASVEWFLLDEAPAPEQRRDNQ